MWDLCGSLEHGSFRSMDGASQRACSSVVTYIHTAWSAVCPVEWMEPPSVRILRVVTYIYTFGFFGRREDVVSRRRQ